MKKCILFIAALNLIYSVHSSIAMENDPFNFKIAEKKSDILYIDHALKITDPQKLNKMYVRSNGKTPLHLAIQCQKKTSTTTLIENGADVNKTDKEDLTPLMYAIKSKDLLLVKELIKAGADVSKRTAKGNCLNYLYSLKKDVGLPVELKGIEDYLYYRLRVSVTKRLVKAILIATMLYSIYSITNYLFKRFV
ncbi:MAG: ankyrin repeat domain-containing protein [Candidatus Babeliales bacterium]